MGNWQARYVYEDGIDQPRCMDRADIADVNGNQNTTEVLRFHYHQQALGSVTEVTQPTGAVVEWVTYDVYGQPTIRDQQGNVIVQSALGNPYLNTGRELDNESNLYFYRARSYDSRTGRFLQRDPLGEGPGPNGYQYASDSPLSKGDALGLMASTSPSYAFQYTTLQPPSVPPVARMPDAYVFMGFLDQWMDVGWFLGAHAPTWLLRYRDHELVHSAGGESGGGGEAIVFLGETEHTVRSEGDWLIEEWEDVYLVIWWTWRKWWWIWWTGFEDRGEHRTREVWVYEDYLRGPRSGDDDSDHGREDHFGLDIIRIPRERRFELPWPPRRGGLGGGEPRGPVTPPTWRRGPVTPGTGPNGVDAPPHDRRVSEGFGRPTGSLALEWPCPD